MFHPCRKVMSESQDALLHLAFFQQTHMAAYMLVSVSLHA